MGALLASGGYVDWNALWKIVVIGLLAGSGLTAVYSVGVVFASWAEAAGRGEAAGGPGASRAHPLAWVGAVFCLLVVLAGVGYGIDTMLAK